MEKINECKCAQEEMALCCKMQQAGLRKAVETLKTWDSISRSGAKATLKMIMHSLETYKCLPASSLKSRVEYATKVLETPWKSIHNKEIDKLKTEDQIMIKMVIEEIETFLAS